MNSPNKDTHSTPAKAQPAPAARSVPTDPTAARMNARVDQPSNLRPGVPTEPATSVAPAPMPARKPAPVGPQPQAPDITSENALEVDRGDSFSYKIEGTHSPSTFAADGLPPGLAIDAKGVISGKPDSRGVFPVKLSATNATGTGSMTLTVTVA